MQASQQPPPLTLEHIGQEAAARQQPNDAITPTATVQTAHHTISRKQLARLQHHWENRESPRWYERLSYTMGLTTPMNQLDGMTNLRSSRYDITAGVTTATAILLIISNAVVTLVLLLVYHINLGEAKCVDNHDVQAMPRNCLVNYIHKGIFYYSSDELCGENHRLLNTDVSSCIDAYYNIGSQLAISIAIGTISAAIAIMIIKLSCLWIIRRKGAQHQPSEHATSQIIPEAFIKALTHPHVQTRAKMRYLAQHITEIIAIMQAPNWQHPQGPLNQHETELPKITPTHWALLLFVLPQFSATWHMLTIIPDTSAHSHLIMLNNIHILTLDPTHSIDAKTPMLSIVMACMATMASYESDKAPGQNPRLIPIGYTGLGLWNTLRHQLNPGRRPRGKSIMQHILPATLGFNDNPSIGLERLAVLLRAGIESYKEDPKHHIDQWLIQDLWQWYIQWLPKTWQKLAQSAYTNSNKSPITDICAALIWTRYATQHMRHLMCLAHLIQKKNRTPHLNSQDTVIDMPETTPSINQQHHSSSWQVRWSLLGKRLEVSETTPLLGHNDGKHTAIDMEADTTFNPSAIAEAAL